MRWAILAGSPEVVKDKDVKLSFLPGADISVTCNEPLCAFILTVPLRVSSPPCLSTATPMSPPRTPPARSSSAPWSLMPEPAERAVAGSGERRAGARWGIIGEGCDVFPQARS